MRTTTATEASRSFSALLDEVERGATFIVTRDGRRVAKIGPVGRASGPEVLELLSSGLPDGDFASDVLAAREAVSLEEPVWPAD